MFRWPWCSPPNNLISTGSLVRHARVTLESNGEARFKDFESETRGERFKDFESETRGVLQRSDSSVGRVAEEEQQRQ
jgi:hypothetical protein